MSFKSKTKYMWEGWESSGREAWVFDASHPRELMGSHAKLIDQELKEFEKVESCLYSPRLSSISTPFGFKADEASWGICVTDRRFIISQNRHIKGIAPRVDSVDFRDLLYFNIGTAVLLSWLSVNYFQEGQHRQKVVLFNSIGRHHFFKALRQYKRYCRASHDEEAKLGSFTPASFLHRIKELTHRDHLKALMSAGERCIVTFSCPYLWDIRTEKRFLARQHKKTVLRAMATFLLTDKALLVARSGFADFIGTSVDVLNVPLEQVRKLLVEENRIEQEAGYILKINFATRDGETDLHMQLLSPDRAVLDALDKIRLFMEESEHGRCNKCP